MGNLRRRVIHCPKSADHPHKKILLLLGNREIDIFCNEHKWLRVELFIGEKPIYFDNVRAKVTELDKNTNFDLDPIPAVAIGDFISKRKQPCLT